MSYDLLYVDGFLFEIDFFIPLHIELQIRKYAKQFFLVPLTNQTQNNYSFGIKQTINVQMKENDRKKTRTENRKKRDSNKAKQIVNKIL